MQLFKNHSKTGVTFFCSESGTIPIRITISVRRLMYWWHILHVDKSEMIYKIYKAKKLTPVSGHWIILFDKDKENFNIKLTDEEVEGLSKFELKKYISK